MCGVEEGVKEGCNAKVQETEEAREGMAEQKRGEEEENGEEGGEEGGHTCFVDMSLPPNQKVRGGRRRVCRRPHKAIEVGDEERKWHADTRILVRALSLFMRVLVGGRREQFLQSISFPGVVDNIFSDILWGLVPHHERKSPAQSQPGEEKRYLPFPSIEQSIGLEGLSTHLSSSNIDPLG